MAYRGGLFILLNIGVRPTNRSVRLRRTSKRENEQVPKQQSAAISNTTTLPSAERASMSRCGLSTVTFCSRASRRNTLERMWWLDGIHGRSVYCVEYRCVTKIPSSATWVNERVSEQVPILQQP